MLSTSSRPYIDASIPVLRSHGVDITKTFYNNMFKAHPELTQIFNMGNQANGAQQQALAAGLFAYAANIDNTNALIPVINRITHKHASVGVRQAHYPIIGQYLIGAIKEVLGTAATPELLAAWDEAYWLLANQLIEAEINLYHASGVEPGEFRKMKIINRVEEDELVTSFTLSPLDGTPAAKFLPGQYISVMVELSPEQRQQRQYSLSDASGLPYWRISVKRITEQSDSPAGAVSNWLYRFAKPGDVLLVSAAFGEFTPDLSTTTPIGLLSAGVGVTPMISILNTLALSKEKRPVLFAHAARHGAAHAHLNDVKNAKNILPGLITRTFYETPREQDRAGIHFDIKGKMQLDSDLITEFSDGQFYLCGPVPFMQAQWKKLISAGIAPQNIHREVFGPDLLDQLL